MNPAPQTAASGVDALLARVAAELRATPEAPIARSVFWLEHGTRLAGGPHVYRNRYVLARVGRAFGACAVAPGRLGTGVADLSGAPAVDLLGHDEPEVRAAVLDAVLADRQPHREDPRSEPVPLPDGTPDQRAVARDDAVTELVGVQPGERVALIGVVNPLIAAIEHAGGHCLPCDLEMTRTQWGVEVTRDMDEVLAVADRVLATGMTVGNGTFDRIRQTCQSRGVPLTVYAQSGSAIVREFLGDGVAGLSAEPFPFSQMSAEPTHLYRYRAAGEPTR